MFGGGFDDIFGNMDRMMNNMMNGMRMNDPFGMMGANGMRMNDPFGMMGANGMMDPFGMMNPSSMMLGMHGQNPLHQRMQLMNGQPQMNNQLAMLGGMGPSMTSFSMTSMPGQAVSYSSKVITTSNQDGKPQIYEQTSSSVIGPNGVKETKDTVRDSRTGIHEIKLGRHINDRGHLKAKKRNMYNGDEEEEEELINLDDNDLEQFNSEYNAKTRDYMQNHLSIQGHRSGARPRLALTNAPSTSPHQPSSSQSSAYNLSTNQRHLASEDTRPPSRGKKVKIEDKKLKKKSKKPY